MSSYLEFDNITMEFPGVKALDSICLNVECGEIVAFLGENGAGKSTLLKILNGDYHPTSGKMYMEGKEVYYHNPNEAIKAGVSVIYQERQLAPYLSVAENIFLGNVPIVNGFINYKELNRKAQKVIDEFSINIKPTDCVKDISVAHQQMVEIMKSYVRDAKIYCFDEPTAPLTDAEITVLFSIIRKLKDTGKAVIYVSHRMKELFELTDRVVVFKDGKCVGTRDMEHVTEEELVRMMVGRDLGDIFNNLDREKEIGDVILEMKDVCNQKLDHISMEIRAGEIVGLSGLAGAGRTEVARAIFGADKIAQGAMKFEGKDYSPKSPKHAMETGIALAPEDRKLEGLSLIQNVRENVAMAVLKKLTKFGFVNFKEEKNLSSASIEQFNIKTPSMEQKVVNLSGGNQQKVILARWMAMRPKLLILDEPTKGIDVGAKSEIYQMICNVAKQGVAVLMISSELPEVIGISDKIVVLKDGRITAKINRKDATEAKILSYAMIEGQEVMGDDCQ